VKRTSLIVLASVAGALLDGAGKAHAGAECPPAVALSADPDLARSIADGLLERGVTMAGADCSPTRAAPLQAKVRRQGGALLLTLSDRYGRASTRRVQSPATVAALIASFAREDLSAPALEPPTPTPTPVAAHRTPIPAESSSDNGAVSPNGGAVLEAHLDRSARREPLSLIGRAEAGFSSDRSLWVGASASGCYRLGDFCLGSSARFQTVAHEQDTAFEPHRVAFELLAHAELGLDFGGFKVRPSVGLGGAWTRTLPDDGAPVGRRDRYPPAPVEFGLERLEPRARADLGIATAVSDGLALELSIGADLTADLSAGAPRNVTALYGLGLGLRWGEP
jgi:hypothetical protein